MGKLHQLKGLVGSVEIKLSRESGLNLKCEGVSVILTLVLFDIAASILHCTVQ